MKNDYYNDYYYEDTNDEIEDRQPIKKFYYKNKLNFQIFDKNKKFALRRGRFTANALDKLYPQIEYGDVYIYYTRYYYKDLYTQIYLGIKTLTWMEMDENVYTNEKKWIHNITRIYKPKQEMEKFCIGGTVKKWVGWDNKTYFLTQSKKEAEIIYALYLLFYNEMPEHYKRTGIYYYVGYYAPRKLEIHRNISDNGYMTIRHHLKKQDFYDWSYDAEMGYIWPDDADLEYEK